MDDTLSVLRMAVARLGLDSSPTQPAQSNVFFMQESNGSSFFMPPCKDFMAEFSNALIGARVPKRRSSTAHTLAPMVNAHTIGAGRAPEIERYVQNYLQQYDRRLTAVRGTDARFGKANEHSLIS